MDSVGSRGDRERRGLERRNHGRHAPERPRGINVKTPLSLAWVLEERCPVVVDRRRPKDRVDQINIRCGVSSELTPSLTSRTRHPTLRFSRANDNHAARLRAETDTARKQDNEGKIQLSQSGQRLSIFRGRRSIRREKTTAHFPFRTHRLRLRRTEMKRR